MFDADGPAAPALPGALRQLATLTPEEFDERRRAVDASFLNQGIGFTVYDEEEASSGSSRST